MEFNANNLQTPEFFKKKSTKITGGLLLFMLMFYLFVVTIIPEGSRGLRFTMGKIEQGTLEPGIHFKLPLIQSIESLSIRPVEIEVDVTVGENGAITKDNQSVGASTKLFISYDKNKLHYLWSVVGIENMENISYKTLQEVFKQVIGKYTIFDVAPNQGMIRDTTLYNIRASLAQYPVTVSDFKITNYDWSDQFETQIERTMEQAQQVKVKQQELLISEQEAQKGVKQAEARKTSKVLEAEGNLAAAEINAKAKAKEGEGLRQYYLTVGPSIQWELEKSRLYNKQLEIQRWDGRYVPTNHYGPIPISTNGLLGPGN